MCTLFQNFSQPLIPFATPYKLKDPVIVLERCDKIWQTLTLIKNAQSMHYSGDSDTEESRYEEEYAEDERDSSPELPYVQYEPVLENKNANFKLSVKTTERLYTCMSCGNFFFKKRDLQAHEYKFHGVPVPTNDFKQNSMKDSEVKIAKVRPTERSKNHQKIEISKDPKSVQEAIADVECEAGQEKMVDNEYLSCLLCNFHVKDVKKHLSTYHKVICHDMMVSQFCKPISPEALKKIVNKNNYRKKSSELEKLQKITTKKPVTTVGSTDDHEGGNVTSKKRRGSELSQTESKRKYAGDKTQPLESHNVVESQPTKDNLPLHKKQQSKSAETSDNRVANSGSRCKRNSATKNVNSETCSEFSNDAFNNKSSNDTEENSETTCVCGRSFRTIYTLAAHKTRCMIQCDIEEREKASNIERGSSAGLHLTIKKHNDSYEIVERGTGNNDHVGDDVTKSASDISISPVAKEEIIVTNLGEYSKNHTFVKLEVVDEDITVDIEDDVTSNWDNVAVNTVTTEAALETDITGKENVHRDNPKSKWIRQYGRKSQSILIDEKDLKPLTNGIKHVCPCGVGYQTEQLLKKHVQQDHALLFRKCGYCKMIFKSATELNEHMCLVIRGEPFVNLFKVPCSYCNMILDVNAFDEHISSKHLVSSISLFKCYECVSYFESMHRRQRHMTRTHGLRCCNFCSKRLTLRLKSKHDAYHFGLGFPCHDCKLAYTLMSTLKDHREIVHSKRSKSVS